MLLGGRTPRRGGGPEPRATLRWPGASLTATIRVAKNRREGDA
ncbi:hypothetical protein HEB29_005041 [Streptomyces fulvorobeus]|uniref:Uncharacterized protein n=1 Tax=Streptomyces fulvorobeus TaxID=284028 RepID=A0A7Y9HGD2_9ACTN|nr:hypothetical protein [Streptomyces fulvorobeus]